MSATAPSPQKKRKIEETSSSATETTKQSSSVKPSSSATEAKKQSSSDKKRSTIPKGARVRYYVEIGPWTDRRVVVVYSLSNPKGDGPAVIKYGACIFRQEHNDTQHSFQKVPHRNTAIARFQKYPVTATIDWSNCPTEVPRGQWLGERLRRLVMEKGVRERNGSSDAQASEIQAMETQAMETQAMESQAGESQAMETQTGETQAAEV